MDDEADEKERCACFHSNFGAHPCSKGPDGSASRSRAVLDATRARSNKEQSPARQAPSVPRTAPGQTHSRSNMMVMRAARRRAIIASSAVGARHLHRPRSGLESIFHVPTRIVSFGALKGLGVILSAPVSKGETVFLESDVQETSHTPSEAAALLEAIASCNGHGAKKWLQHSYPDGETVRHCATLEAALVNHSSTPTVKPGAVLPDPSSRWVATRELSAGEELTYSFRYLGDYAHPPAWYVQLWETYAGEFHSIEWMEEREAAALAGSQLLDEHASSSVEYHGAHVTMDFLGVDFASAGLDDHAAGRWLMDRMVCAVEEPGTMKVVHQKCVPLPAVGGTSPPGFTSAVLIDESHVTAHCYSDRGWLAIDVFTCGGTDPRSIAATICSRLQSLVVGARCVREHVLRRFPRKTRDACTT